MNAENKFSQYVIKNINLQYLRNGRFVGEEEYSLEVKYKNTFDRHYMKKFLLYYDELEKKYLENKVCWHCSIPFEYINYKGCYYKDEYSFPCYNGNEYICKNCYLFVIMHTPLRKQLFQCSSCGHQKDIIHASVHPTLALISHFNTNTDLLCLNCCRSVLIYLANEKRHKHIEEKKRKDKENNIDLYIHKKKN